MFGAEPLKPSNTGRLIADILPDTQAFLWSRTEIDPALLAAINDPARQPYVVFPASYADAERPVFSQLPAGGKPPLFIMLDGTWAEARKMFRKARTSINSRCFPQRRRGIGLPAARSQPRRATLHGGSGRRPAATGGRSAGRRRIESAFPLFPSTVSGGKTDPAGGTGHSNVARKRLKSGVTSPKGAVHEPARVRSATTSQIDRRAGRFAAARPRRQPDDEQPAGRRIRRAHLAGHAALQGGMRRHGLPRRRQPAADAGSGDHLHPRQTQSGAD